MNAGAGDCPHGIGGALLQVIPAFLWLNGFRVGYPYALFVCARKCVWPGQISRVSFEFVKACRKSTVTVELRPAFPCRNGIRVNSPTRKETARPFPLGWLKSG